MTEQITRFLFAVLLAVAAPVAADEPIKIRGYYFTFCRMPTFGLNDQQLNGVIRYFGSISNAVGPFQTHEIALARSEEAVGRELFELLKCQQCHVLGAIPKDQPTANLAPDLRMAPERLNPEWILEWLKNPAAFLPGTRMPAYWPEFPNSPFPQLGQRNP